MSAELPTNPIEILANKYANSPKHLDDITETWLAQNDPKYSEIARRNYKYVSLSILRRIAKNARIRETHKIGSVFFNFGADLSEDTLIEHIISEHKKEGAEINEEELRESLTYEDQNIEQVSEKEAIEKLDKLSRLLPPSERRILSALRINDTLNQEELARKLGISPQALSKTRKILVKKLQIFFAYENVLASEIDFDTIFNEKERKQIVKRLTKKYEGAEQ